MKTITSVANPLIKEVVKLKKTHVRRERGLIIVDGHRETEIALKNGWELETIYLCPELWSGRPADGLNEKQQIMVSKEVFERICYKEKPDGVLAVLRERPASSVAIDQNDNSLILILEGLEKPGNIGAIIRTASAAGVSAIILNDCQTDIYNPNVIRSSQGEVFTQRILVMTREATVKLLKNYHIKSLAAVIDSENNYFDHDLTGPMAIVLGSEDRGLSVEWREAADIKVKIPMVGEIDSLNVSVAAAILVFEARRQQAKEAVNPLV